MDGPDQQRAPPGTARRRRRWRRTPPPWWPCATPTVWSWPGTAGPRRATSSPTGPWRRSFRPIATRPWPSPARPAWPSRWSASSRSSSSTMKRSKAPPSRSRARPTSWPRWCVRICPWPCRASWWCHCSPGTTPPAASAASSATTPPGATTRRPTSRPPGSGGRNARSTIKLGWREGLSQDERGRPGHPVPVRGGRRGLGHRRTGPGPGYLPAHRRGRRRGLPARARRRGGGALRRPHRAPGPTRPERGGQAGSTS